MFRKCFIVLIFMALLVAARAVPVTDLDQVRGDARFENLARDWVPVPPGCGWSALSATEMIVTNQAGQLAGNAGRPQVLVRAVEQAGVMCYEWSVKLADFGQGCVFYFFSSDSLNRAAYVVRLWVEGSGSDGRKEVRLGVAREGGGRSVSLGSVPVRVDDGAWNRLGVKYDSGKGEFALRCNGKDSLRCGDPVPLKSGKYVGLGTAAEIGAFRNVSICREE